MTEHKKSEKYTRLASFGMGPYAMKKLKVCPNCGHLAKKWSFLCPSCKKRLNGKTLFDEYKKMHTCCSVCQTPLTDVTRYCPHCGKKQTMN